MVKFDQYIKTKGNLYGYLLTLLSITLMLAFAFSFSSFQDSFNGLIKIASTNDNLISDYVFIGGLGGAFLNAALVTFFSLILVYFAKADMNGPVIAGLFTVVGFAFFGKDISNILPIFGGVYLHSLYQKEPLKQHIVAALFGTTMAPIVSAVMFQTYYNLYVGLILGTVVGLLVGFVLPYVAKLAYKIHNGFNLYNIGFSSGLILMILVSFLRVVGFKVEPVLFWSEGNNVVLSMFLGSIYLLLFTLGFLADKKPLEKIINLNKEAGVAPSDFYSKFGIGNTFFNMAFIGLISHIYILIFNVPLNGPTIGGVLTIVAFGAYGKNIKNVSYILIGAALGHYVGFWNMTTPSIILGALFGTGIAPIAGKYGIIVGVIAIFLHIGLVQNVGALYLGLNLYNNGFAEGFTGFMIPLVVEGIRGLKKEAI